MNVFSFLAMGFLIARLIMLFIVGILRIKPSKNSIKFGLILGAILFCDFTLQTYALRFTYSSSVAFIAGFHIIFVPILMFIFFMVAISKMTIISALFAIAGLYLLNGSALGESLAMLSALTSAFFIVFIGKFIKVSNIYILVTTQFFSVGFIALIFAILFETPSPNALNLIEGLEIWFGVRFVYVIIFTSLITSVVVFFIQTAAQRYISASKTALILALEPVSAGLIGYFVNSH